MVDFCWVNQLPIKSMAGRCLKNVLTRGLGGLKLSGLLKYVKNNKNSQCEKTAKIKQIHTSNYNKWKKLLIMQRILRYGFCS